MNKGIILAKNEIIGILNVDDFYEPNVLNSVTEIFKNLPKPSFLVGNCNVWDTQGNLRLVNKPAKLRLTDLLLGFDINPFPMNPSAYFYHKSLHNQIGFYEVEEHYVMDLDFILKAVQVAQVKYVDETWGNFRNIKGTKSLNAYESGQVYQLQERLLNPYRKSLSINQQLQINIGRFVGYFPVRIRYFYQHPYRLIPSFRQRLKRIFDVILK
jgi:hypothetical protein